jgi:hypothetical protein
MIPILKFGGSVGTRSTSGVSNSTKSPIGFPKASNDFFAFLIVDHSPVGIIIDLKGEHLFVKFRRCFLKRIFFNTNTDYFK